MHFVNQKWNWTLFQTLELIEANLISCFN